MGEVSNLLTYECFYSIHNPIGFDGINLKCGFDRDPENIAISEGDIITIRTEKDFDDWTFFNQADLYSVASFLFTFFIELDPL